MQFAIDPFAAIMADAVWPPFIASLLIGLPSVLLYLLECFTLVKHWRSYKSSFFLLFLFRAAIHIFNFFASFLFQRFGKVGIFVGLYQALPPVLLQLLYFLSVTMFHVENLANFFLLLNRLTSIAFPFNYEKIWHYSMPFAFALTLLVPVSISYYVFGLNVFTSFSDSGNSTFVWNYTNPAGLKDWTNVGFTQKNMDSAIAFLLVCLLLNCAIFLLLKFRRAKLGEGTKNTYETKLRQALERRMLLYTLLSFLGQLLMAIYMCIFCYASTSLKGKIPEELRIQIRYALDNQFGLVNDICTVCVSSWLLILVSRQIRASIGQELGKMCITRAQSTTIVPLSSNVQRQIGPSSSRSGSNFALALGNGDRRRISSQSTIHHNNWVVH